MSEGSFLKDVIKSSIGSRVRIISANFVSGGCISNTLKLNTTEGNYFLKWKQNEPDLFMKEKLGLEKLSISPIKIPKVIDCGRIDENDFLLLKFIERSIPSAEFWPGFGQKLANQHRLTNDTFGLDHDNYIGRLPQINTPKKSWIDFFISNRLEPQLILAEENGHVDLNMSKSFDLLLNKLSSLLPEESPALLHGDLWSGNFMIGAGGKVYIFDPAVYYGHREAELAFTYMFGGFDPEFYLAYDEEFPLQPEFDNRVDLYNLYPLLVHLNLFGESYLRQISSGLKSYI